MKASTLKRNDYMMRRDYTSPSKSNYVEMKEVLSNFPNPHFSLKRKDYGTMQPTMTPTSMSPHRTEFSKPEHTSTKYYQRLEESPRQCKSSADTNAAYKRSLLPSARKYAPASNTGNGTTATTATNKPNSRDSLNSSESNNSVVSNLRQSPVRLRIDPHGHSHQTSSRRTTPPRFMSLAPPDKTYMTSRHQTPMPPSPTSSSSNKSNSLLVGNNTSASLPPKPNDGNRNGSNTKRGENRYRIQF